MAEEQPTVKSSFHSFDCGERNCGFFRRSEVDGAF